MSADDELTKAEKSIAKSLWVLVFIEAFFLLMALYDRIFTYTFPYQVP